MRFPHEVSMNLKKRFIAIAVVAVMAAAAIYGSTMEMRATGEEGGRLSWFEHKETIYLWYTDEALTDYLNGAAVSFGEKENVRVIPVLASDSQYLEAVNQASLKEEQMPDVYLISNDSLEKAYLAGLAGEILDEQNLCTEENFPKAALSAIAYKGKNIAYPLFYETSALIYNETYLREWARQQAVKELSGITENGGESTEDPEAESSQETNDMPIDEALLEARAQEYFASGIPATVDDILQIADTFDVPEGVEGIMEWDVSDIFFNYWVVGQYMTVGGDAGDDESNININNQETVQCLEVYKSLNQFFSMEAETVTYESVVQNFMEGKTVFTIGTTDVIRRLEDAIADGSFSYDYGITSMPDINAELKSRSMSVTNVAVVNGYTSHKELANRFAAYLTGEYVSNLYGWTGKTSPYLKAEEVPGTDARLASARAAFLKEYGESISLPKMMETGNFWLQLEVLFSKVWNGADVPSAVLELSNQMAVQTGTVPQEEAALHSEAVPQEEVTPLSGEALQGEVTPQ